MFGGQIFMRVSKAEFLKVKADAEYWRGVAESYRIKAESTPQATKLYTVEVLQGGKPFRTYRDVVKIEDNRLGGMWSIGCVSSLILKTRNGDVILRGEGYTYISTEQKPEGEAPPEHMRGRIEYLIRQIEKLESENEDRRHYVGTLNHRIEMLELRLGNQSFGKQTEPTGLTPAQIKAIKKTAIKPKH